MICAIRAFFSEVFDNKLASFISRSTHSIKQFYDSERLFSFDLAALKNQFHTSLFDFSSSANVNVISLLVASESMIDMTMNQILRLTKNNERLKSKEIEMKKTIMRLKTKNKSLEKQNARLWKKREEMTNRLKNLKFRLNAFRAEKTMFEASQEEKKQDWRVKDEHEVTYWESNDTSQ